MRLLACLALPLLLTACVTDSPTDRPDASSQPDSGTPDSGTPDSGAPDVPVTCPAGTADCDPNVAGCETSLLSSDTDCGACGHDCGGKGLCNAGVCQPMVIADKAANPVSLSVAGPSVFWMIDQEVQRCPVTGCPGTPGDVGDSVNLPKYPGLSPYYISADATNVYWAGYTNDNQSYSIFTCPDSGCGQTLPAPFYSPGFRNDEMVGNATNLYWLDPPDGAVFRVTRGTKAETSLGHVATLTFPLHMAVDDTHFLITDGNIAINGGGVYVCDTASDCKASWTLLLDSAEYVATNGATAFVNQKSSGAIVGCDLGGCSGSGTVLATKENGVSAITADSSYVYWAIRGSGTAPDGTIRACKLPDCKAGPVTLAVNQPNPTSLVNDGDFVYWADKGTGQANTGRIVRVRKPL